MAATSYTFSLMTEEQWSTTSAGEEAEEGVIRQRCGSADKDKAALVQAWGGGTVYSTGCGMSRKVLLKVEEFTS